METYAETYDYHYHHLHGAAQSATASAAAAERHVLAERYKTKMCRNYLTQGECPYEVRCMFAHGDHELRTCEMNVRDGLITEEAIKAFQRTQNMRNRHAYQEMYAAIPDYFGMPPVDVGPDRYTHNPYGYSVMRPSTPEDFYQPSPLHYGATGPKVDPSAAMEP